MVSMRTLFPACVRVLRRELCPMHYGDLTDRALQDMDIQLSKAELVRAREDVREKLLYAGQRGTAYLPDHGYRAVLVDWFPGPQCPLFNWETHSIIIPGNASAGETAVFEAVMRSPHMVTKIGPSEARERGKARGLTIEHHVSLWFKGKWPEFYRPPENDGQYDNWCRHDFRLALSRMTVEVDVMGPRRDGSFGTPKGGGKRAADIHVVAAKHDNGRDIALRGFQRGVRLKDTFRAVQTLSPTWLIVWLNCESLGIEYSSVAQRLTLDRVEKPLRPEGQRGNQYRQIMPGRRRR